MPAEVISATRGNHGQSIGWAARAHGVRCTIVVPHGNSSGKERRHARTRRAPDRARHRLPGKPRTRHGNWPGSATPTWCPASTPTCCAAWPPTGGNSCGRCRSSMWCTCPSARARAPARPLPPSWRWAAQTRIVGVVSSHATTYADSLAAGHVVEAPVTTRLADGMACRVADPEALAILQGAHRPHRAGERRRSRPGHARPVCLHPQRSRRRRRCRLCGGHAGTRPAARTDRGHRPDRGQCGQRCVCGSATNTIAACAYSTGARGQFYS